MSGKWRIPSKDQSISRNVVCVLGGGGGGGRVTAPQKRNIQVKHVKWTQMTQIKPSFLRSFNPTF